MEAHRQSGERRRSAETTVANAARCERMWRPWHNTAVTSMAAQHLPITLQQCPCGSDLVTSSDQVKLPSFQHPVKLFWPKSKYYDFLYQDAEELLKNFPVQATIVLYEESDSSSGSEDEESTDN